MSKDVKLKRGDRVIKTTDTSGEIYVVDAFTGMGRLKLISPENYKPNKISTGSGVWVMSDKVRLLKD